MARVLLLLSLIAMTATTTTTAASNTKAASTAQAPSEEIRVAQRAHNFVFGGYVALLALTVFGTYWVWRSGNKVQNAIQANANARIEEAKGGVTKLENDNLKLSGDLEAEKGKVAGLQKDAADAKAAQQRVEIELAKQRERTAIAERALLELKQKMADRHITPQQRDKMLMVLRAGPPRHLVVQSLLSAGREALQYASEIADVFRSGGWDVTPPNGRGSFEAPVSGVILVAGQGSEELTDILVSVLIAGEVCKIPVGISASNNTPPI